MPLYSHFSSYVFRGEKWNRKIDNEDGRRRSKRKRRSRKTERLLVEPIMQIGLSLSKSIERKVAKRSQAFFPTGSLSDLILQGCPRNTKNVMKHN